MLCDVNVSIEKFYRAAVRLYSHIFTYVKQLLSIGIFWHLGEHYEYIICNILVSALYMVGILDKILYNTLVDYRL